MMSHLSRDMQYVLTSGRLPRHVAIIMDGNGRWAAQRGRPRVFGHRRGVDSVRAVVEYSGDLGIKALTLFAFSEENWGRPATEVQFILSLLNTYIRRERKSLLKNNVVFRTMGDLSKLPESSQSLLQETKDMLSGNSGLVLNVALSYGGRQEIVDACKKISRKVQACELSPDAITMDTLNSHLESHPLPFPDLMIRTSGEYRISNFLLWQLAYSELYFAPVCWPDFSKKEFEKAILAYATRDRRFGLVSPIEQTEMKEQSVISLVPSK